MISAYVAGMGAALLMVAGAVYDGGRFVNAYGEASDLAGNAARAAAQAADQGELYRSGTVRLDSAEATRRAIEFLDVANPDAAADVFVEGNTVTVTVSLTSTPRILPIGTRTIRATATATAQRGVEQPSGAP